MSVETREFPMPQPEKWLSEHEPFGTLLVIAVVVALCIGGGWLLDLLA